MKRTLLLFVLVAVMATLSAATIPMIYAGLGTAWVSGNYSDDTESVFGFMVGAGMEVDSNAPMIMEYGARFRTAGWKESGEYYDYDYEYEYEENVSFNYLDIYAKAKYEVPLGNGMYFFPFAGYAMGILLTAEAEWKESEWSSYYGSDSYSHTGDVKDEFNTLNHSLLFGADVLIAEKFILGIEYSLGLSNIWKESGGSGWTSSALMFKAGMSF